MTGDLEKEKIQFIGDRIGMCFDEVRAAILKSELTIEDLEKFAAYIEQQDAFMPVLNPTLYRNSGMKMIPVARDRTAILITLVKHTQDAAERIRGVVFQR